MCNTNVSFVINLVDTRRTNQTSIFKDGNTVGFEGYNKIVNLFIQKYMKYLVYTEYALKTDTTMGIIFFFTY